MLEHKDIVEYFDEYFPNREMFTLSYKFENLYNVGRAFCIVSQDGPFELYNSMYFTGVYYYVENNLVIGFYRSGKTWFDEAGALTAFILVPDQIIYFQPTMYYSNKPISDDLFTYLTLKI